MSFIKSLFLSGCNLLPIGPLKKWSPVSLYLPYHHLVNNKPQPHINQLYHFKNEKQFIQDLEYLLKHFNPISVNEIIDCVKRNKPFPKNSFLITFDDGFQEIRTVIAPILEQKGVPAIFFINPSFVDNKELFYRLKVSLIINNLIENRELTKTISEVLGTHAGVKEVIHGLKKIHYQNKHKADEIAEAIGISFGEYLKKYKPFVTEKQLEELIAMGFSIGGHSMDHPFYPSISPEEQVKQTLNSVIYLSERFGIKEKLFAFPHSDVQVKQKVIDDILRHGIDLLFGIQNQKYERNNRMLHRFNAERPNISLEKQLKAEIVFSKMMGEKYKVIRQ